MTTAPKTEPSLLVEAETAVEENSKRLSDYVREHPGAFIAGGVVLGVVLGALIPRRAGSTGSAVAKRALALAATAGELGLVASRHAREGAEKAAHEITDRASHLLDDSAVVREKANQLASVAREVGQKAVDRASTLASRLKH